jgi:curved DNA-binding protein CbpA
MAQTYYELLGVAENATDAQINAAFKSKAVEVHPDKVAPGSPYLRKIAAEAFKDLSEARSVLLDRAERRRYDAGLAYMRGATASSGPPSPQAPPSAAPSPGPVPQSPPKSRPAHQPLQKQSFWKPIDTKFGIAVFAAAAIGCLLVLGGIIGGAQTVPPGLTLILISLGLFSWRHGMRPGTNPKILGGSIFIFIFALILLDISLSPSAVQPQPPLARSQALKPQTQSSAIGRSAIEPSDFGKLPTAAVPRNLGSDLKSPVKSAHPSEQTKSQAQLKIPREELKTPNEDPIVMELRSSGRLQPSARPSDARTYPEPKLATADALTTTTNMGVPTQGIDNLTADERTSLESACSRAKYNQGPAAYNQCLKAQLGSLAVGAQHPDLSGLSPSEHQSIESACSRAKYNEGPAAYNQCLKAQLGSLAVGAQHPDLSGLTPSEHQSIESACSRAKYNEGPAAYNECLKAQLGSLAVGPQHPDLSGLTPSEHQSIESACSRAKYNEGPAEYNRCLVHQLDLLKASSH